MPKLTQERLKEVLSYDPETGIFRWISPSSNRIHVGERAGAVGANGRRFITIDGETFQAHRLAWFYVHAEWPDGDIKQLNGDYEDCSLANLQPISRIQQARLRSTLLANIRGLRGVSPAARGKWRAAITASYKKIMLGAFNTKEEASAEYERAMEILADAKTPNECEAAIDKIIQHRRKRVAWDRVQRSGRSHEWASFAQFSADVGYMEADESTVAAEDESRPIGPTNFRWLVRPKGEFDRSTREGRASYAKAYRDANPGRWRHSRLRKNYGIGEIEYHRMLEQNGARCFICDRQPLQRFAIDHNHDTKDVRGLLCKQCNYAMGQFGNDPDRLRRAAEFLELRDESKRSLEVAIMDAMSRTPNRNWLCVSRLSFGA